MHFTLTSTSQLGLATFQVLGSHMWPMAFILDSVVLEAPTRFVGSWVGALLRGPLVRVGFKSQVPPELDLGTLMLHHQV